MSNAFPAIIVVEDEPDILLVLRRVLRDLETECDIIAVDNGRAALEHGASRYCSVLITDYRLGDMNGLQLAKEFKHQGKSYVIMLTGYSTAELKDAAKEAGVDTFLPKPFQVNDLEAAIRTALDQTS
jgi:two-component system response regulator (stage 0 sporulation protein F)